MKKIIAKFNSLCAESGKKLLKGDSIYYDPATKKAYHITALIVNKQANDDSAYIQAQESAYWDKITVGYYTK